MFGTGREAKTSRVLQKREESEDSCAPQRWNSSSVALFVCLKLLP